MKIKFRVWDKKYKRFLEGGEVIFDLYNNDTCEITINELGYDNTIDRQSDFIVMQYIGINDINNQEIYTGDIIINNIKGIGKIKGIVGFQNGCFFDIKNNEFISKDCEVIGNTFENIDLLTNNS